MDNGRHETIAKVLDYSGLAEYSTQRRRGAKTQRNKQLSRIYVTDMINDYNDITIKTIKTVYKEIYSLI